MPTIKQRLQNLKLNTEFKYTLKVWATSIFVFWATAAVFIVINHGFHTYEPLLHVIGIVLVVLWFSIVMSFIPMLIFYVPIKKVISWQLHFVIKKLVLSLSLIIIMACLAMLIDGNPRPWITLQDDDAWFMSLLSITGIWLIKMPKLKPVEV